MNAVLPLILVFLLIAASFRKVRVYDSFAKGAGGALPLVGKLFPYIAAVLILANLFEASALSSALSKAQEPLFSRLGVPAPVVPLVLVKPFSGSGSLALVGQLCSQYGADSYIGRCACAVYATGETVFYLSALYFAGGGRARPVVIALFSNLAAALFACLLCQIL